LIGSRGSLAFYLRRTLQRTAIGVGLHLLWVVEVAEDVVLLERRCFLPDEGENLYDSGGIARRFPMNDEESESILSMSSKLVATIYNKILRLVARKWLRGLIVDR
jgi:hypothetical protein